MQVQARELVELEVVEGAKLSLWWNQIEICGTIWHVKMNEDLERLKTHTCGGAFGYHIAFPACSKSFHDLDANTAYPIGQKLTECSRNDGLRHRSHLLHYNKS